jgi:hypothetical protein
MFVCECGPHLSRKCFALVVMGVILSLSDSDRRINIYPESKPQKLNCLTNLRQIFANNEKSVTVDTILLFYKVKAYTGRSAFL